MAIKSAGRRYIISLLVRYNANLDFRSFCYTAAGYICKATAVTHTKRIDRNLLRKETSFVCYTSSVIIQIECSRLSNSFSLRVISALCLPSKGQL